MPEEAVLESPPDATQLASFMQAGEAFTRTPGEPAPEATATPAQPAAKPDAAKPAETPKPEAAEQTIPEQILTGEKPPTEPQAADEVDEELPPGGRITKEQEHAWANIKRKLKAEKQGRAEALKAAEEARTKLTQAPSAETVAQLKSAQDRAAELEQKLERSAFEQSPRFQQYLARDKQNIESAKAILEGTEVNPNAIDLAARATPSQRLKILKEAGMDAETIASVSPYLADIDRVTAEKNAALAQHKEFREQDAAQEKAQQEATQARQREEEARIFKAVGETVATKFTPFQKVEGQDKWNAQVDQLQAEANEFFAGRLPLEKLAEIAYAGVAYRVEAQINQSLREQLKAAKLENAQLKAAQPDGGTQTTTPLHDPNAPFNPADTGSLFERNLRAQAG